MMSKLSLLAIVLTLVSLPAIAQDRGTATERGSDKFLSGGTVTVDQQGIDDLFAAGATVNVDVGIAGSAYVAGRTVDVNDPIGGDAFIAGMEVAIGKPVSGDATIAGFTVTVDRIDGDLRASGGTLTIGGPVEGYAMLSGDEVRLENVISGDVYLKARKVDFGSGARLDGRLVVFEQQSGSLEIPNGVISEERIERRQTAEWDATVPPMNPETWWSLVRTYLTGALVIALAASLIAAIIPRTLAQLRRGLHNHPVRSLWFGFLAESVAVGSAIIFAVTLIGLLLIPVSLIVALAVGIAGYIVAAYALGVGLLMLIGRPEPSGVGTRIMAAGTGALVVSAVALVPYLGWLFVLALVLSGVGAITMKLFQPAFYVHAHSANIG